MTVSKWNNQKVVGDKKNKLRNKSLNILIFSDMHDQLIGLEKLNFWLENNKFDLALSCGDLSSAQTKNQVQRVRKIIDIFKNHHLPFLTIAGNNEREETINAMEKASVFLEEKEISGWHLVGISGWGDIMPRLTKPIDQNTILVTHVPPKLSGKINLNNAPFLHLHGHLHCAYNRKVIGNTTIITVPPLMRGQGLNLKLPSLETKVLT
jgi:Icc-related predicted phosphoesterase